jgi:hypothetical protein
MEIKSGISKNNPTRAVPPNHLILDSSYIDVFCGVSCFHTKGSTSCENRNIHNYYSVTNKHRAVEQSSSFQRILRGEIFQFDNGRNGQLEPRLKPKKNPLTTMSSRQDPIGIGVSTHK